MKNPITYDYTIRIIPKLLILYGFYEGVLLSFLLQRTGYHGFMDLTKPTIKIPSFHFDFVPGSEWLLRSIPVTLIKNETYKILLEEIPVDLRKERFFFASQTMAKHDNLRSSVILGELVSRFLFLREDEEWGSDELLPVNYTILGRSLNLTIPQIVTGIAVLRDLQLITPNQKYYQFDFRAIRLYIKELK